MRRSRETISPNAAPRRDRRATSTGPAGDAVRLCSDRITPPLHYAQRTGKDARRRLKLGMKTRFFRTTSLAIALAIGTFLAAFTGCMADVHDTPSSWADPNKPIGLTESSTPDPSCVDPKLACSTTCASTSSGANCNADCDTQCGFASVGAKHCTCSNGTFSSCYCSPPADCAPKPNGDGGVLPPAWWQCWGGASKAPSCFAYGAATGRTAELIGQACPKLFDECIGTDYNTGTPRGCACIPMTKFDDPTAPIWVCGSTNHWFDPE